MPEPIGAKGDGDEGRKMPHSGEQEEHWPWWRRLPARHLPPSCCCWMRPCNPCTYIHPYMLQRRRPSTFRVAAVRFLVRVRAAGAHGTYAMRLEHGNESGVGKEGVVVDGQLASSRGHHKAICHTIRRWFGGQRGSDKHGVVVMLFCGTV